MRLHAHQTQSNSAIIYDWCDSAAAIDANMHRSSKQKASIRFFLVFFFIFLIFSVFDFLIFLCSICLQSTQFHSITPVHTNIALCCVSVCMRYELSAFCDLNLFLFFFRFASSSFSSSLLFLLSLRSPSFCFSFPSPPLAPLPSRVVCQCVTRSLTELFSSPLTSPSPRSAGSSQSLPSSESPLSPLPPSLPTRRHASRPFLHRRLTRHLTRHIRSAAAAQRRRTRRESKQQCRAHTAQRSKHECRSEQQLCDAQHTPLNKRCAAAIRISIRNDQ